ncbi:GNAT family N-acetyltransferase [Actinomadura viridis]|uniref:GNAT superfamily N-acetyltransferase n=1 Tax=Actinomadura viridis TaxID=58110 RepID=A0A931DBL0_9ACTN|nr:GNAT family N-acetyltransferase [Actinomadura viridis]MBG6086032.1 GNAT superfamily N-acetyltransferase [Actinomadura viridis]
MTYEIRDARPEDLDGARGVMLDTFYRDLGYGYRPEWHRDVIDLEETYLRTPRHALFVAARGGQIVGTAAVRAQGPRNPPHPAWLTERYPDHRTAQLFRVYVRREHRRNGLARALVGRARDFVAATPGYERLYLHSDTRSDGAEPFWRSVAEVVHDERDGNPDHFQTVHYEIPLRP